MEVENIVFLGAGASAAEGAPLQRNLIAEFFRSVANELPSTTMESLRDFFRDMFGLNVTSNLDPHSFPTFEEILGVLDLATERKESFRQYPATGDGAKVYAIRRELIYLIARTLKARLAGYSGHHAALVTRLKNEGSLAKTAFISVNYDIMIDNALMELQPDFDLDYGVDFTNFRSSRDWHKPDPSKSVQLHKLHGSLNWLYCPTCVSVKLTPKEKRVATLIDVPENCSICQTSLEPIIVPPTFLKVMANYYLQQIWRRTEEALMNARCIWFCGYSFPDADIHIKYLLKRMEVNSLRPLDIFVINHPQGERAMDERKRYLRFMKYKDQVRYLKMSFEEFCERGVDDAEDFTC